MSDSARSLWGEFLGTSLLLYVIVGSGIAVERLSRDGAVQLSVHAVAVGAGLAALIAFLAPVSGAHFNPAVTLGFWLTRAMAGGVALAYVCVQVIGAVVGAAAANATFGDALVAVSATQRGGVGRPVSELIATFVLVLLILGLVRTGRIAAVAPAVGAWVAAIIIATVSTGFANPAVTVARVLTDSFTGIRPASAPAFLVMQLAGGAAAAGAAIALFPRSEPAGLQSASEPEVSP